MKKLVRIVMIAMLCAALSGCYTFNHQVGNGASTGMAKKKKQWFILWGLVPLTEVDSKALAGGASDYDIQTQMAIDDVLISIITSWVTVYPQTVTVTK
ncbi:MAG: hypothetical protein H6506_04795 [Calditrichaeota bacterium]|nr:hypothetical protein [Calditrichota bacterium]MCB9365666.1 hypothetical protein [Calditrichota bacterium]MCB9391953.1 hypothetical protein [Calditrichota bacterium]